MDSLSLFLVSACYGGRAQAGHLKSLLALRAGCRERGAELALNFAGSEALASRGQARWLAKFLASSATHLILAEGEAAFMAEEVLELVEGGGELSSASRTPQGTPRFVVISRRAAELLAERHSDKTVGFSDVGYAKQLRSVMVFEAAVDPETGRYLDGFAALEQRWREIAR